MNDTANVMSTSVHLRREDSSNIITRVFNYTNSNGTTALPNWTTEELTTVTQDLTTRNPDDEITWDDATWILTSAFIIFTMQSG